MVLKMGDKKVSTRIVREDVLLTSRTGRRALTSRAGRLAAGRSLRNGRKMGSISAKPRCNSTA